MSRPCNTWYHLGDMTNVFLSYGHNAYDELAKRVLADLNATGEFDCFFDLDSLEKGDWEELITKGIEGCEFFLFFVSSRSVSLDGYCLNELSRACELKKEIIPILLDESYCPLSITRLQRLNLKAALSHDRNVIESVYHPTFEKLLRLLRKQEKLGFYNKDFDLSNQLQAYSSYEIAGHLERFTGRQAAIEDFGRWVKNPSALPIYLLEAAPGVGKSALSAMLTLKYPESVAAIHFCVNGNQAKTDAKNVIINLACQLSCRNEDFASLLNDALKRESLAELDAKRLFEVLLLEPGAKATFVSPQVLIVDALDEALEQGKNELAEILLSYQNAFPKWLRFYCTSRPQESVTSYFRYCQTYAIDEQSEENEADIRQYYETFLPKKPDEEGMRLLMKKSHGSFLYAHCIAQEVSAGKLSVDDIASFPDGIYSYYRIWFDRIFSSFPYAEARPVLALLLVTSLAPSVDFIAEALGKPAQDVLKVVERLSSFFRLDDGACLSPRHKTILDWLSNRSLCPADYFLTVSDGARSLLPYIKAKRAAGRGWKRDPYVILDYGKCLKILGRYDELCDLLRDEAYQNACSESKFYTLYQSLSEYFRLLGVLYDVDPDYAYDIYDSPCFRSLFGRYRKRIYNSGLFLGLKRCEFGRYLSENKPEGDIEFEIGELSFYYISLSFQEAYEALQSIEKRFKFEELPIDSRCEIERMGMLVLRKLVEWGSLEKLAPRTIEDARLSHSPYEESLAYLTLSKVYCRQLRKQECFEAAEKAIAILQAKVEEETDEFGTQIGDHLFLAEDYRVYADALIWHGELDKAKEMLDKAYAIYALYNNQHDRYYQRVLYTTLFYEIAAKGSPKRIASLAKEDDALIVASGDGYDLGQLRFLLALSFYLRGDLESMKPPLNEALEKAASLSVPVERLEAETLAFLAAEEKGEEPVAVGRHNEYTDVWIDYVKNYIIELRRRYGR